MNMFDLTNKYALVTGATGYLGKEIALALASTGAHVLINSRTKLKCDALVNEILCKGYKASSASFDVTDHNAVDEFISNLQLDHIDIIVNNSYAGGAGSVELSSSEAYRSAYDSSLVSSAHLFTATLPLLREAVRRNGYASVINIASMYGMVSPDQRIYDSMSVVNPPFYGSAKAALIYWTKYAGCEFAKENIRINCISPGPFPSMQVQNTAPKLVGKITSKVPMGRVGRANEIAGPVVFLASSASSFMVGANIPVDGGWTCW
ncbi:NAD(P)-dependent dehydrogenase, short-chain alcohol dehydrogenase family [Kosakonia radicincitans]|uniref:SDR family NAD(P)-dependent oxidoreductase n=1 Tax=Kosakonia radicincitans TaxID=283686 RepID=UPI0009C28EB0|nr:SDR family oxidoreductase [Kosakonia radicincitans]SKC22711.1 NAD(P)-dependent dehydrogenase, short-chain alcohol dehydrogenase family [Kosakonia radicincitans]